MSSAAAVRRQIEAALEARIPSALTPRPRVVREQTAIGIPELDALLEGGLPLGAISELVGPPCSGRTTLAQSVLAGITAAGKAVAWVDTDDTLDPESAAAAGIDLSHQLWVRCGAAPASREAIPGKPSGTAAPAGAALLVAGSRTAAPSGGCGSPHPRGEARGLSDAVGAFMQPDTFARPITPRGPGPQQLRPNQRKNRIVGTPGAPNRKLSDIPASEFSPFPRCAPDREEQIPTDRLPARRGENLKLSNHRAPNLAETQIAYTAAVAEARRPGAQNSSCQRNAPDAAQDHGPIAAGLPRFREMEARANGQDHGTHAGPFARKPSVTALRAGTPAQASSYPLPATSSPGAASQQPSRSQSLAGDPPNGFRRSASPLWKALDQALRATDLLLAAGGFSAIVLDLGSTPPDFAWRIPLATWFRFRAGAERARTVLIVLTQHPCTRSSAELVLRLDPVTPETSGTVLTGAGFQLTIDRQRFEAHPTPEVPSQPLASPAPIADARPRLQLVPLRKPPQRARAAHWQRPAAWARGAR